MNTAITQLLSLLGIMQGIVILLTSAPSEAFEVILYSFLSVILQFFLPRIYFLLLAEGGGKNSKKVFASLLQVSGDYFSNENDLVLVLVFDFIHVFTFIVSRCHFIPALKKIWGHCILINNSNSTACTSLNSPIKDLLFH